MGAQSKFNPLHPEPLLVVISGLSGAGKDSVIREMKARQLPFHFVVTATDRPPRSGEVNGVDYIFLSTEEFEAMIARGEFIEHAVVYGDLKGVPKKQVQQALASGKDVILRLDVQGAERIHQLYPQALLIFISVEDEQELIERLKHRRTDDTESIQLRLDTARKELERVDEFDYVVINREGQLENTVDAIEAILHSEHQRVKPRMVRL